MRPGAGFAPAADATSPHLPAPGSREQYLDDAGYDNWEMVPYIYKAMVMNAFPPIDALDMKRASLTTRCEMRTGTLAFMKVLDLHIKTAETTAYNNLTDGTQMSTDLGKVKCA